MIYEYIGYVLQVAVVLHVLFCLSFEELIILEGVSESAVSAATNFVSVSCQQTAYIAGRGLLSEEVERFKSGM